jgi:hypothetical protein
MSNNLVVTRHPALVQLLRERGLVSSDVEVLTHVEDPTILDDRHVFGVLPLHLAARCASLTEIPLAQIRPEERGTEIKIERLRELAGEAVTYVVRVMS